MKLMKILIILMASIILFACAKPLTEEYNDNLAEMHNDLVVSAKRNIAMTQNVANTELPGSISQKMSASSGINAKAASASRFDVSVNAVPADVFFSSLTHDTHESIVVSPDVTGNITLNLKHVTLEEVLKAVRENYGYQYEKMTYGYNIFPRQLETRVFLINQIDVDRTGESTLQLNAVSITDTEGGSTSTSGSTLKTKFENHFWTDLKSSIAGLVGADIADGAANSMATPTVKVNQGTGVVVVRAYPHDLDKVQEYLDKTQNMIEREVIIEAEILDVVLSKQHSTGIDWSALTASSASNLTLEPTTGLIGSVYKLDLSGDNGNFDYAVNMLSSQGSVSVLSRPRVSALNNQSAIIKVGTDEYYVVDVTSEVTTSGDSSNTSSNIELKPFFSGIALDVTPQITDDGIVNLHIHPSITRVTDDEKDITVDGSESILPLAKSTVRETDAVVRALSGQVIILGGLMESNVGLSESGPSLDSKYDGVNQAFTDRQDVGIKDELVILLRPVIVDKTTWAKQLTRAAAENYQSSGDELSFVGDHSKAEAAKHLAKTTQDAADQSDEQGAQGKQAAEK